MKSPGQQGGGWGTDRGEQGGADDATSRSGRGVTGEVRQAHNRHITPDLMLCLSLTVTGQNKIKDRSRRGSPVVDLSKVPSTHVSSSQPAVINSSSRGSNTVFWPPGPPGTHVAYKHICG